MLRKMLSAISLVSLLLVKVSVAGPLPDAAMAKARSLQEYLRAESLYTARQRGDDENMSHRRRLLENNNVISIGPKLAGEYKGGVPGFYHGVASGDPLSHAVILWYVPKIDCLSLFHTGTAS